MEARVRSVIDVLLPLAVAYLVLAAIAWFFADRMIFQPPPPTYHAGQVPVDMVPTEDGLQIATLFLPNPDARFTLLYSHGNGEDLGRLAPILELYRNAGFSVLAYDYRGYGLSEGSPTTSPGVLLDIEAVYRHATTRLGIDPSRILLFGFSVGSGPSVHLAAREAVGGVVLESPFVSAYRVLTRVPLLPFDRFPNLKLIDSIDAPLLVIHGTADPVIGQWHGRRLYRAASGPKQSLWVEGGGHGNLLYLAGDRYFATLREFAQSIEP
jgi:abhydrolase domain-containing protein 17